MTTTVAMDLDDEVATTLRSHNIDAIVVDTGAEAADHVL